MRISQNTLASEGDKLEVNVYWYAPTRVRELEHISTNQISLTIKSKWDGCKKVDESQTTSVAGNLLDCRHVVYLPPFT